MSSRTRSNPLTAVKGVVGTAELPLQKALELASSDRVAFAELGQPLVIPDPALATGSGLAKAPPPATVEWPIPLVTNTAPGS